MFRQLKISSNVQHQFLISPSLIFSYCMYNRIDRQLMRSAKVRMCLFFRNTEEKRYMNFTGRSHYMFGNILANQFPNRVSYVCMFTRQLNRASFTCKFCNAYQIVSIYDHPAFEHPRTKPYVKLHQQTLFFVAFADKRRMLQLTSGTSEYKPFSNFLKYKNIYLYMFKMYKILFCDFFFGT